MKILIGTNNPSKIMGAKLAFETYFKNVEILNMDVDSEVSSQPINKEIFIGAKNRVLNLKRYAIENNINDIDYYISSEAGLIDLFGDCVNVNLAYIEDNDKNSSFGLSQAFPIPNKYVDEIKEKSLGKVFDEIFNEKDLSKFKGGINLLSKGEVDRIELVKNAFIMALTKYINDDLWK